MNFDIMRENDWYKSRSEKYSRTTILKVLFVGKNIVMEGNLVRKKTWEEYYERCSHIFQFTHSWTEIKEILRCMQKRYANEKKHDSFQNFYSVARQLWRVTLENKQ